jgi:hypothetical protein
MVSIVSGERWRCPHAEATHPELVAAIWQADLVINSLPETAGRGARISSSPTPPAGKATDSGGRMSLGLSNGAGDAVGG